MENNTDNQHQIKATQLAGLVYVSDTEPGIIRRRAGQGFMYIDPSGKNISDEKTKDRIKSLAIPPAYRDVWICLKPNGHIQATGSDNERRKQYIYHPQWENVRKQTKYHRMISFGHALPKIRRHIKYHIKKEGLPQEKVIAAIVALLETTLIRIGNEEYMKKNKSYGLTTLKRRHINIADEAIRFRFKGKRGIQHEIHLEDESLAEIIGNLQDLPGQQLFKYQDDEGGVHHISSTDINEYLQNITGENFTAKDFRTWKGTVLTYDLLLREKNCSSEQEAKKCITRTIAHVAEKLGNTPAVCRSAYIHPVLLDVYQNNLELDSKIHHKYKVIGLRKTEALVMTFLEKYNQNIGQ